MFQSLLAALMAAGHQVVILTGCSDKQPTEKDLDEKMEYMEAIGCGSCYDKMVVFGDPPHRPKARWIKKHHLDFYVDNSVMNCQAAAKYTTVFLAWNAKSN
jgi:hypothetical protein